MYSTSKEQPVWEVATVASE